ncbi:MAG TPA: YbiU family protein [Flexivirga sp.]|uniref:YbiU family protein n=1 Tax=Flexivirga sp. TaxID=1962927 RepID=UPI002BB47A07|nr:YbiU family protein [Flexivirga sp.]HWC20810.1 YbiU family protein [Flexivirga sp.]
MPTTATPTLPHWPDPPQDLGGAIREIKLALRQRIEASGRSVTEVFEVVERRIAAQVAEIQQLRTEGRTPWPIIEFDELADLANHPALHDLIRRRGCVVIRGHFPREQAHAWDADIVDYVERNHFFENYRGPGDDFFGSVGSKPEIYPVYWSHAQMEARQSDRMATVQSFLNHAWRSESEGQRWFDPDRGSLYPDRIRRRPPGADSAGLGTHLDPGTLDLWMTQANQQAFRHLFDGSVEQYDPWDAAYRTSGKQYPGSTMCSAFRTFQGWTALSDMRHDQGVLQTVPIPEAMAYLMLRPLLEDVPDDDMCGVTTNQVFPAGWKWHPLLMEALSGLPDIQAGDSVWWHCDMIHGVDSVQDQVGWGNVMYIPAAPWCPRNEAYAESVRAAFRAGDSPSDFPAEHYERDWVRRFSEAELNDTGRRGLGLTD